MEWKPRISVSTACYDGYPVTTAFDELSRHEGIDVELAYIAGYVEGFSEELFTPSHAADLRGLLARRGLRCEYVSAHTDLATDGGLDRGLRRIRFTAELGASNVISNAADIRYRDEFFRNLEQFSREAERVGVRLLLENPGDGIRNVVDDGATAATFSREYAGPAVGINYDFGNVISHFAESRRPERDWLEARPIAEYLHLKDVVREGSVWRYPTLGTGMIDYRSILREVAADQRFEALGIELPLRLRRSVENPAGRSPAPQPLGAIAAVVSESLSFLRQTIA